MFCHYLPYFLYIPRYWYVYVMWSGVNLQRNNFTLKKKLDPILICFEALREIKSLNFWWKSIKFVILQFSVLLNSLNLNEKFCSLFITPGPIHFCFSQNNIPEEPVAYSRCHILLLHICTLYFALFHSTLCQNDRKLFTMLLKVQYRKVPQPTLELWLYKNFKKVPEKLIQKCLFGA